MNAAEQAENVLGYMENVKGEGGRDGMVFQFRPCLDFVDKSTLDIRYAQQWMLQQLSLDILEGNTL